MDERLNVDFWDGETDRAEADPKRSANHASFGTVTHSSSVVDLRDKLEKAQFDRFVPVHRSLRVLDLGGGAGRFAIWLAPRVAHVTVVDTSSSLLDVGRREASRRQVSNVSFVECSALDYRPEEPFDLVLVMGLATHLASAELDALMRLCSEALVPGGRLVLKEPVSTDGTLRHDERHDASGDLVYRAWFRPGEDYTRAAAPHLQPLHRSPTCAHPIPRFLGGTNEAAESVGNGPAARLLSTVAPFWVATDPLLQAVEQRVRSHAQTRWLLADVPVLQELFVFVKPLDAQPARTGDPALSVVVIAYNEDEGLVGMVDELMATLREGTVSFEIVLVDDGSTDETGSIMESLEKEHQGVTVRRHTPNRGIGGALRAGFDAASGNYLTWLPADSQIPPGVVLELFDRRRLGAIVTTVYRERADHWMRNVISKSLNAMIWLRTGHVAKSGGNYLMSRATWEEYGPRGDDSMMLSTAFRNNVRNAGHLVIEHEIDCRARAAGRSKVLNPTTIFRTVAGLLRAGER